MSLSLRFVWMRLSLRYSIWPNAKHRLLTWTSPKPRRMSLSGTSC